jgi:hypothetical protein
MGLTPEQLKTGYDWSYREFYRWGNIMKAASAHSTVSHRLRHAMYSTGWKKFEPAWDLVIRVKQLSQMRPLLETILSPARPSADPGRGAASSPPPRLVAQLPGSQAEIQTRTWPLTIAQE